MKVSSFVSLGLVCAALSFTASLYAGFGSLGNTVQNTAVNQSKGVARGAVAKEYNKKLEKEKCHCNESVTAVEGCNIDKIVGDLRNLHDAAEGSGFANDVDIDIRGFGPTYDEAYRCASLVRDKVKTSASWYDYTVDYEKAPHREVTLRVSIR